MTLCVQTPPDLMVFGHIYPRDFQSGHNAHQYLLEDQAMPAVCLEQGGFAEKMATFQKTGLSSHHSLGA